MIDDRSPSTAEVVRAILKRELSDVHTGIPARVESYDPAKQTVDVQPLVQKLVPLEGGGRKAVDLPVLPDIPVSFPAGGGMRLLLPLQKGDTGWVMFSEASLDVWRAKGGVVDPADPRRFHLSDGVFVPGLHAAGGEWKDGNASDLSLGKDGAHQLVITPDVIELGGNSGDRPSDWVALAGPTKADVDKLRDAMNAGFGKLRQDLQSIAGHTHNVETAGTAVKQSGTTLPSTSLASLANPEDCGTMDEVKSAKVKSK